MADYPRRGEIHIATTPGHDKQRPVLIVSINARNERANSVIVVPITSNLTPAPTHVALDKAEGGLTTQSMARCENLAAIPKAWIRRGPIGPEVSDAKMIEIEGAISRAIGIPA